MIKSGSAVFMIGAAAFGLPLLLRTLGERKTIYFVMQVQALPLRRLSKGAQSSGAQEFRRARAVLGGGAGAADGRAAEPQHRQSNRAYRRPTHHPWPRTVETFCGCRCG